jgi:hypothetical protein
MILTDLENELLCAVLHDCGGMWKKDNSRVSSDSIYDEFVKSLKKANYRHSGESRNPVISDNYKNTGHRFSPVRRLFTKASYIAHGSNCELETQVLLSGDLGYIEAGKLQRLRDLIGEVERMLKALIRSLEDKHPVR